MKTTEIETDKLIDAEKKLETAYDILKHLDLNRLSTESCRQIGRAMAEIDMTASAIKEARTNKSVPLRILREQS